MSQDTEVIKLLIKSLGDHKYIIDVICAALADHAVTILPLLPKCNVCSSPATVKRYFKLRCDRCCAEAIYRGDSESSWKDLPRAQAIRNMIVHYENIVKLDESPPVVH